MTVKWIGAIIIIASCGSFGFSIAAAYKREEQTLLSLIRAVEFMICELEHRVTPLPDLCRMAGMEARGCVGEALQSLSVRLEQQISSDASKCMAEVLACANHIPWRTRTNLNQLGQTLGKFALSGQVSGFKAVAALCQRDLASLSHNKDAKLRSYRTLGICAGVALVILFF